MAAALKATPSSPRPRAATTIMPAIASPSQLARKKSSSARSQRSPVLHQGEPTLEVMGAEIMSTVLEGPLRHPKPMSPSDLHLALEREQEAMVNRFTRELSVLRQQTASVASTASSSSTMNDPSDPHQTSPLLGGFAHFQTSRRQRSCSSLSAYTAAQSSQNGGVTGIAPSRESSMSHSRVMRSREPSLTSRRPSIGSITSYAQQHSYGDQLVNHGKPSIYRHRSAGSQTQLADAASYKSELDNVKRENEQLRRRIRDLEIAMKKQKKEE
ncbi:Uncharacterized protein PECH_005109 [Penicillium ucsense]|uniref:Uncharacterized protein n=1 Tax=Penicillium ucsense TaxID=2839758 RepID=A0A8J8WJX2_9EURO|nr:Uncharacterized protein PECM_005915 [Penicillium ucsense]KAF7736602.1 Uncharacterized protein PECH_005109 [Penicillium ucsense]